MGDDEFSAERVTELVHRVALVRAADQTPEMESDVDELIIRLDARERAVIGRFLESVRRAAHAYANGR